MAITKSQTSATSKVLIIYTPLLSIFKEKKKQTNKPIECLNLLCFKIKEKKNKQANQLNV